MRKLIHTTPQRTTHLLQKENHHLPSLTIIVIWHERWQYLPMGLHLYGDRKEHADMVGAELFMFACWCVCPCVRWSSPIVRCNCFPDWFHSVHRYTETRAAYSQIHPACSAVGFQLSLLNTVWNRQSCHHCSQSCKIAKTFFGFSTEEPSLAG